MANSNFNVQAARVLNAYDTYENWAESNKKLIKGEVVFDNTNSYKVCHETGKTWSELAYPNISVNNLLPCSDLLDSEHWWISSDEGKGATAERIKINKMSDKIQDIYGFKFFPDRRTYNNLEEGKPLYSNGNVTILVQHLEPDFLQVEGKRLTFSFDLWRPSTWTKEGIYKNDNWKEATTRPASINIDIIGIMGDDFRKENGDVDVDHTVTLGSVVIPQKELMELFNDNDKKEYIRISKPIIVGYKGDKIFEKDGQVVKDAVATYYHVSFYNFLGDYEFIISRPMLTTNTFGASDWNISNYDVTEKFNKINNRFINGTEDDLAYKIAYKDFEFIGKKIIQNNNYEEGNHLALDYYQISIQSPYEEYKTISTFNREEISFEEYDKNENNTKGTYLGKSLLKFYEENNYYIKLYPEANDKLIISAKDGKKNIIIGEDEIDLSTKSKILLKRENDEDGISLSDNFNVYKNLRLMKRCKKNDAVDIFKGGQIQYEASYDGDNGYFILKTDLGNSVSSTERSTAYSYAEDFKVHSLDYAIKIGLPHSWTCPSQSPTTLYWDRIGRTASNSGGIYGYGGMGNVKSELRYIIPSGNIVDKINSNEKSGLNFNFIIGTKFNPFANGCFYDFNVSNNLYVWNNIGSSTAKVADIFTKAIHSDTQVQTSDETKKNILDTLKDNSKYERLFMAINPIAYSLKEDETNKIHLGLGAQSVEQAMKEAGFFNPDQYGIVSKDENNENYGLCYNDLFTINIMMTQKHQEEIQKLKEQHAADMADLKEEIRLLRQLVGGK